MMYKNTQFDYEIQMYFSYSHVEDKMVHHGFFGTEKEAAKARDEYIIIHKLDKETQILTRRKSKKQING